MSSEWLETTLGGFVRLQRGHDLTAGEQQPGQYPVMGSAGQNGSHNIAKAQGPGVVVGRSGASMGRVHYSEIDYWPHNTCLYVTDFQGNNPRFAYYVLSSLDLAGYNSGSAQPSLNRNYIYGMPLRIPSRAEQDLIVQVLSALDDRIALLRETNATLEAMAQALFKSWFVDFDPVHANAGTRTATLPADLQALFPSTFTDTPQGLVPEGWGVGKVDDLLELAYGKALKATDREDGEVPVYGSGGITGSHNQALVSGPSVIVGRKGTVGSLYWEDRPFFPIDTVFYVKTDKPLSYCFYLLQTLGLHDMNTDGAVPGLNRNNVYRLPVAIPSDAVFNAFDETAAAIRETIFTNNQQAQTLAALRDTLLPRLISGQLRLPDAEAVLAEVGA